MAVSVAFAEYVLEQLAGLGRVRSRRMFGGVGIYLDESFFGLIASDVLYFRVDDSNRADYESRGMERFRPNPDKPEFSMSYYAVPADALDDAEELVVWARRSIATERGKPSSRADSRQRAKLRERR